MGIWNWESLWKELGSPSLATQSITKLSRKSGTQHALTAPKGFVTRVTLIVTSDEIS
jgi:hypothetical protein